MRATSSHSGECYRSNECREKPSMKNCGCRWNTKDFNKLGGRWLRTKWWDSPRAPAAINSKNRYYLGSHKPASTPSLAIVSDKKQRVEPLSEVFQHSRYRRFSIFLSQNIFKDWSLQGLFMWPAMFLLVTCPQTLKIPTSVILFIFV